MLVRKVDGNTFISKQRYILRQWHQFVVRQRNFVLNIENSLQKSLWKAGFEHLK